MNVTWHSFDLLTGRRGPQVRVAGHGAFGRIIGEPTETTVDVYCWDEATRSAVPGWDAATLPGRTMLVALTDNERPVWGGMVLRRRSDEGPVVGCDVVTTEAYFDRRYVTDRTYENTDQGLIVSGVLADVTGSNGITLTVDAPATGLVRDRSYFDDEDKTVLSVLQELSGVIDGPEFTVDLDWADTTRTVLRRTVRVRNRLGVASMLPEAVFEMPGAVTGFAFTEDYSSDQGATDVMAYSSGEGEARPESRHYEATDLLAGGWPRFEHRFTPSTSIKNTGVLDAHAAGRLAEMREGLAELTLEAHLDTAPRVGYEFNLGDDVAVALTAPRFPAFTDADGAEQPGYSTVMRCVGWTVDIAGSLLVPTLRSL